MKTHPIAKMFPMLDGKDMDSLTRSILADGLINPCVTFDGVLLDGRNRIEACRRAGVEPRFTEYAGDNPVAYIMAQNLARRHLTESQRAAIGVDLLPHYEKEAKKRQGARSDLKADLPSSDGGRRPQGPQARDQAAAAVHVSGRLLSNANAVKQNDPEMFERVRAGEMTIHRAMLEIAEEAKRAEDAKTAKDVARRLKKDQAPVVYHEPFTRTAERIQDNSVALIFTDPPYDTGSVPLYGDLANVASRVLVDGGSLICYCGHRLIPKIIDAMRPSGLSFYWILACIHSGSYARMPLTGQIVTWKPMLWWVKGKDRRDTASMLNDSVVSDAPDKKTHAWQQGITEALYYIEKLTKEGELVFEPFCGGGTTVVAARRLRRLAIACDIEATAVAAATKRIEEETAS